MVRVSPRAVALGGLSGALVASAIALAAADDQVVAAEKPAQAEQVSKKARVANSEADTRALVRSLDPRVHTREGEHLWAPLANGARARLTLDPDLQARAQSILESYQVPYGALVALEPSSGRVLAYVSHSSANPDAGDLARDATPPAASVFKIITAAALVDEGLNARARVCYRDPGFSGLRESLLVDDAQRDRACSTLDHAVGGSINTVFAKLAQRHLTPAKLARYADAFGFGQALPFDTQVPPSPAEVPSAPLEFARTAAGFWHMHMSPLHGALIAATFANDGSMPRASMIDELYDASGKRRKTFAAAQHRAVLSRSTARAVGQMMRRTVEDGTAHSAFFDERGRPYLPNIAVAGKTGSLSAESPYRGYSWWVGFAPADKPTIALAALVVNTPKWRIKGSYLAREALREYLVSKPERARKAAEQDAALTAAASSKARSTHD